VGKHLVKLLRTLHILPISSAACERGFSQLNLHQTSLRNRLSVSRINDLMMVSINGPPLSFQCSQICRVVDKIWPTYCIGQANWNCTKGCRYAFECQIVFIIVAVAPFHHTHYKVTFPGQKHSFHDKRSFPGQALSQTDDSRTRRFTERHFPDRMYFPPKRRFPDIQRRCSIQIDTSY